MYKDLGDNKVLFAQTQAMPPSAINLHLEASSSINLVNIERLEESTMDGSAIDFVPVHFGVISVRRVEVWGCKEVPVSHHGA